MARRGDGGARYFAHTSEWKWHYSSLSDNALRERVPAPHSPLDGASAVFT